MCAALESNVSVEVQIDGGSNPFIIIVLRRLPRHESACTGGLAGADGRHAGVVRTPHQPLADAQRWGPIRSPAPVLVPLVYFTRLQGNSTRSTYPRHMGQARRGDGGYAVGVVRGAESYFPTDKHVLPTIHIN